MASIPDETSKLTTTESLLLLWERGLPDTPAFGVYSNYFLWLIVDNLAHVFSWTALGGERAAA